MEQFKKYMFWINLLGFIVMIAVFIATRHDITENKLNKKADKEELVRVETDLEIDIREGDAKNAEDLQLHITDQKEQFNRIEAELRSINEYLRE